MRVQLLFFLLAEAGAEHPSLNPFFYFLAIVFKYLILPVPWPVRLLALWDQLTKREQRVSIHHNSECFQWILRASLTSTDLAGWTSSRRILLHLSVPVLLSTESGERMGLVAPLSLSLGSLGLFHNEAIVSECYSMACCSQRQIHNHLHLPLVT